MLAGRAPLEVAGRLGLALGMAVFMGLAFEGVYKREARTSPGGIRTFPLLAIAGALLYLIEPETLLAFAVGLAAVAIWLYAHLRAAAAEHSAGQQPTLMIPTANLLAYTLGPVALTQPPWLVVAAAVTAVLLLEGREALHRAVQRVPPDEIFTLGKFLILVGIVLPLVPNKPVVDWIPITPFQVWLALVAVSALSYVTYLLERYLPATGALLPSILGGAYSSTATTVALARERKACAEERPDLEAGIEMATAVMYLRLDIVVAFFNLRLARMLLLPSVALFVVGAGIALWRWAGRRGEAPRSASELVAMNPLQLSAAATFAALFVIVTVATSWVRVRFGPAGVYTVGALSGVTDITPFALSLAQGGVAGVSSGSLAAAILISASSNNVVKAAYALVFGGARACLRPALVLLAMAALGVIVALLYLM
jgi:uncharacterized membrane protein (DUF4010 family)